MVIGALAAYIDAFVGDIKKGVSYRSKVWGNELDLLPRVQEVLKARALKQHLPGDDTKESPYLTSI